MQPIEQTTQESEKLQLIEEDKKIRISQEDFIQETKRPESYLSLLPAEINKMAYEYAFNTLEQEIYRLRKKLGDVSSTSVLPAIAEVARKYSKDPDAIDPEIMSKIAVLLLTENANVRAPVYEYFDKNPKNKPSLQQVFSWIKEYIESNNLSYHDAITFVRKLLVPLTYSGFIPEAYYYYSDFEVTIDKQRLNEFLQLSYFFNKRYKLQDDKVVPLVRILIGLGSADSQFILRSFMVDKVLKSYAGLQKKHIEILNNLYSEQELKKIGSHEQNIQAFKHEVCNSLAYLLEELFDNNQKDTIEFLVNTILYIANPDKSIEECFIQKFKGELGDKIAEYLEKHYLFIGRQQFPLTDMMVIILEHVLKNPNRTKLLFRYINFSPSYADAILNTAREKLVPRKARLLQILEKVTGLTNIQKLELGNTIQFGVR